MPFVALYWDKLDDTNIRQFDPDYNYGAELFIRTYNQNKIKSLIRADLSGLPSNIHILRAELWYRTAGTYANAGLTLNLHRSLVQWYEGQRNGATPPSGEDGSTWNYRNHNGSVPWVGGAGGAAGQDYVATPTDSITCYGVSRWHCWDVTSDVQGFVDGTYPNYGWWLITPDGSGTQQTTFTSTESSAGNLPYLLVFYTYNSAATIQFGSITADTHINQDQPTYNYGTSTAMCEGRYAIYRRKILVNFNLPTLPTGHEALEAGILLRMFSIGNAHTAYVYPSLVQWYEGIRNDAVPSEDGSTWNYRNHWTSTPWEGGAGGAQGYDHGDPEAGTTVARYGSYAHVILSFNVLESLQKMYNGELTPQGWWITHYGTTSNTYAYFYTRNHVESASPSVARPRLYVISAPKEEAWAGLSGLSGLRGLHGLV